MTRLFIPGVLLLIHLDVDIIRFAGFVCKECVGYV